MSLFSSLMRDFNSDPFFSGPMESMRQMEALMDSMMSPFDMMGFSRPASNFGGRRQTNALMPFGFGRSLFPNVDDMFASFQNMAQDPNVHCYTSSSVMSYTTDENGRPQLYQASASTRTAPGGVKETRQTVQDSRSGLQSMAIGHHLGERAHIVERKRNRYTGEEDENQEFVNLDEDEADSFNSEWQQRARQFMPQPRHPSLKASSRWRDRSPAFDEPAEPLAITAGPSTVEIEEVTEENETKPIREERHSESRSELKQKRKAGGSARHHKSGRSKHEKTKHMKPSYETSM